MNQCTSCQREYDPHTFIGCKIEGCRVRIENPTPIPTGQLFHLDDPVELIPRCANRSIFQQRWRMGAGWP